MDVFRANFMEMRGTAASVARDRGEEITDKFLTKLQAEHPEGLNQAETPAFQDALFSVQKEYAKAGDKNLGDLLVSMLVDRAKLPNRDIEQLIISEALLVAPKLTNEQVAALTTIFLTINTRNLSVVSRERFAEFVKRSIEPMLSSLPMKSSAYVHMGAVGCGLILQLGGTTLAKAFLNSYTFMFMKGFSQAEVPDLNLAMTTQTGQHVFMPCTADPTKWQLTPVNLEVSNEVFASLPEDKKVRLNAIYASNQMPEDDVKGVVLQIAPSLSVLFECWDKTPIPRFMLSAVGIAIAHAKARSLDAAIGSLDPFLQ